MADLPITTALTTPPTARQQPPIVPPIVPLNATIAGAAEVCAVYFLYSKWPFVPLGPQVPLWMAAFLPAAVRE